MKRVLKGFHPVIQAVIIMSVVAVLIMMVLNPNGAKSVIDLLLSLTPLLVKGGNYTGAGK